MFLKMHKTTSKRLVVLVLFHLMHLCNGSRVLEVGGVQTMLALENEDVVISCEDDLSMSYCGFTHPNGTTFPFAGMGLSIGHCFMGLRVVKGDSGLWTCHIGHQHSPGIETTMTRKLRVVNQLAAVEPYLTVQHGDDVTLRCTTSKSMLPLKYCRFRPPGGQPFSIDARVTRNNPILGKYYFPENVSLDRGDCAVVIRRASLCDEGAWSCEAWIEEYSRQYADLIELQVQGHPAMLPALTTGISFSGTLLLAAFAVVSLLMWRRNRAKISGQIEFQHQTNVSDVLTNDYKNVPQITVHYANKSSSDGFLNEMYGVK